MSYGYKATYTRLKVSRDGAVVRALASHQCGNLVISTKLKM